jgi:AraC-like DNA-binding protein
MIKNNNIKNNFLKEICPDLNFSLLFENLPSILFFVKDTSGHIIMGNKLFIHHCGFQNESDLIGKSDYDIFSPELAEQYIADDNKVMASGEAKSNIIELFPNYMGDPIWFMTNKIPLFNREQKVIGVCGTCQSYEQSSNFIRPYLELSKAVDFIKENFSLKVSISELADMVNLSTRQFERRFKETFKTTVHQYILKLRILKSCELLLKSNMTIADVALDVGFYDQSAYTRFFKKFMKETPLQYQKKGKENI